MDRRAFMKTGAMGIAHLLLAPVAFAQRYTITILPLLVRTEEALWHPPAAAGLLQISDVYRVDVRIAQPLDARGAQASALLDTISEAGYAHVLGLTSVPLRWKTAAVSGLANLSRNEAVVTDYWRKGHNDAVTAQRILSVAVHELGHNFGARNCDTYACTMYDAADAAKRRLDGPIGVFCDPHREQLSVWLR